LCDSLPATTYMQSPTVDNDLVLLPLDETIYCRDAVLRTCYWFTDRCYIFISRPSEGVLLVSLRAKESKPTLENPSPLTIGALAGEFQNYLLDQQLRIDIELQTRGIRELLIAKAFSESGVMDDSAPGDVRDPVLISESRQIV
jgi:His-Xaa-Ser system protein HxsD